MNIGVALQDMVSESTLLDALGVSAFGSTAESTIAGIIRLGVQGQVREACHCGITQPVSGSLVAYLPASGVGADPANYDSLTRTKDNKIALSNSSSSRNELLLPDLWIRSIVDVRVNYNAFGNDAEFDAESILASTEYALDTDYDGVSKSGILRRLYGVWPDQEQSVKVTYVSGLTSAEFSSRFPGLVMVLLEEMIRQHRSAMKRTGVGASAGFGGSLSETIGGQATVSYDKSMIPSNATLSLSVVKAFSDAGFARLI